jgi:drug/metabolite transporter (DMT)-like permease
MGQFLLCGVLNLVTGLFVEHPSLVDVKYVIPAILYTGVFSVAIGFTLQIIAQRNTSPSDTALILCLESVFAAFFGWLFLHEVMLPIQVIGCAMILAAVVFVQVVNGKKRRI